MKKDQKNIIKTILESIFNKEDNVKGSISDNIRNKLQQFYKNLSENI